MDISMQAPNLPSLFNSSFKILAIIGISISAFLKYSSEYCFSSTYWAYDSRMVGSNQAEHALLAYSRLPNHEKN